MAKYKVYFLIKDRKPIYIGHTKRLSQRIPAHRKKDYDCIRWMDCKDKEHALYYEKRWQLRFKPKYNKNGIKPKTRLHEVKVISENTRSVNLQMAFSHDNYAKLTAICTKYNRPIGNYIVFCVTRGMRNDMFVPDCVNDYEPQYKIENRDATKLIDAEYEIARHKMTASEWLEWLEDLQDELTEHLKYARQDV